VTEIVEAWPGDIGAVRRLFEEYATSLGFDLAFQDFERELRDLPGGYAPPGGRLLVARARGEVAGCVGVRRLEAETCEMKRLYVSASLRGSGVGRALATAAVAAARELGYDRIRLDTVPSMVAARELYRSLGFREIEP
jgi:ribosomal protein S18 acetylase RimI-like enzyme